MSNSTQKSVLVYIQLPLVLMSMGTRMERPFNQFQHLLSPGEAFELTVLNFQLQHLALNTRNICVHTVNEEYHDGGRVVRLLSVRGFNSLCGSGYHNQHFQWSHIHQTNSNSRTVFQINIYWGQLLTFHCNYTAVTQIYSYLANTLLIDMESMVSKCRVSRVWQNDLLKFCILSILRTIICF